MKQATDMKIRDFYFKNIVLVATAIVAIFSSCTREMDELFDTPATERVTKIIANCKSTLQSSPTGWYLHYTTPQGVETQFLMKFAGHDSVSMFADFADSTSYSSYTFNYGQGPVLSFNTYSLLHILSDPDYGITGVGYEGDFEFIIMSVSPDSIVLNGRKNRDLVVLRKAEPGFVSKYRLNKQMDFEANSSTPFFHGVTIGSEKADMNLTDDMQKMVVATANGSKICDITYNDEGFELSESVVVGGQSIKKFAWNTATKKFIANNQYALESANSPAYSIGSTADQIIGKYYQLTEVAPSIASWYETLSTSFPNYKFSELYFKAPRRVETATTQTVNGTVTVIKRDTAQVDSLLSYSFVFNKAGGFTVWNNFKGAKLQKTRADQIVMTGGIRDGENANELNLNKTVKNIPTFFYNSSGFTVVNRNNYVYLVSIKDSKQWLKLTKGDKNPRIQTIYK